MRREAKALLFKVGKKADSVALFAKLRTQLLRQPTKLPRARDGIGHGVLTIDDDGSRRNADPDRG